MLQHPDTVETAQVQSRGSTCSQKGIIRIKNLKKRPKTCCHHYFHYFSTASLVILCQLELLLNLLDESTIALTLYNFSQCSWELAAFYQVEILKSQLPVKLAVWNDDSADLGEWLIEIRVQVRVQVSGWIPLPQVQKRT